MPPPSTTGQTNSRYSSIRPSFVAVAARPAPPTAMSLPGCSLSRAISSATSPVASRALPSTVSSVFENTIFGRPCQMWANSRSNSEIDGLSSAVSQ